MGKAFVAKLAKEGARDPEALAAWIGRKKHGKGAFAKLSAAGRKKQNSGSNNSNPATARQATGAGQTTNGSVGAARSVHGARLYGDADRMRQVVERGGDRFTESATASPEDHDATLARTSPSFRRKVQEARASGRPWLHQVGRDTLGAEIHTLEVKDAAGKTQKTTFLERDSAAWNRLSSEERAARSEARMQGGDVPPLVPARQAADAPAPAAERAALPSPEEQRAAGIAGIAAANARAAEQARQEQAERRQRNLEALQRINDAPGKVNRKAMTPEERGLVGYEATGAALQVENYERLRPFADESAQTNRIDVLKSRAFHKARAMRIKNGWAVPGEARPRQ